MNDTIRLIRDYLEAVHGEPDGPARARRLLADDLEYVDPLMTARDADDLIRQIEQAGGGAETRIEAVVGEGGVGAALTFFRMPGAEPIAFTQWFRIEDGKIASIRTIYDPRPFLEMMGGS
ncbi:MAG: nuclear transport factor 2 family protein [Gemmatimonadales bacterium]|jgi:hypothetical protein